MLYKALPACYACANAIFGGGGGVPVPYVDRGNSTQASGKKTAD